MIGIFDSGLGGLTVLKEYLARYPDFDYLYLGDQANSPYGPHSKERVEALVTRNVDFLAKEGCELIIVACNTASADALRAVQGRYKGKPVVLGVLVPAVEEALRSTRFGKLGVIGTRGVVSSGAYEREVLKYVGDLYKPKDKRALETPTLMQVATPLLVPFVEEGDVSSAALRMVLRKYLRPLKHAGVDTLVLGCTHYPLLQGLVERMMGKSVKVISSAMAAVDAMENYFERHADLAQKLSRGGSRQFLTTDDAARFSELGSLFLGSDIKAEKLEID